MMTRQENWNGTKTTIAFDARGLFSGIRHTKLDGTLIVEPQYVRDAVGAPIQRRDTGGVLTTWLYDEAGQLRSEWRDDGHIETITFDPAGNWSVRQVREIDGTPATVTWQYDAASQISTQEGPGYFSTLTYDANGNMRSVVDQTGLRNTWTWDARDRLLTQAIMAGVEATYTYRHDNLRATVNVAGEGALLKQVWDVPGMTGYGDLFEELTSGTR